MTFKTTIERENNVNGSDVFQEFAITVEYDANKASKGTRDSYGVPMEPDEDASIEIIEATFDHSGDTVELTKEEQDRIEQEIWEDLAKD